MNPYDELVKNRSLVAKHYAAMMFNSTTYRMFKKGQLDRLRKFLIRRIGDGRRLAKCGSGEEYIVTALTLVPIQRIHQNPGVVGRH
jgi:hypothetical protein